MSSVNRAARARARDCPQRTSGGAFVGVPNENNRQSSGSYRRRRTVVCVHRAVVDVRCPYVCLSVDASSSRVSAQLLQQQPAVFLCRQVNYDLKTNKYSNETRRAREKNAAVLSLAPRLVVFSIPFYGAAPRCPHFFVIVVVVCV